MGMTIDEAKTQLIMQRSYALGKDYKAIEVALATMRKYQKIEQIIEVWHQDIYAKDFECMAEVAEVIEDGKID